MSPWEIVIPVIWAGGLLAGGFVISGRMENDYYPDYFFPAVGLMGLVIFGLGLSARLYRGIFIFITIALAIMFMLLLWRIRPSLYRFVRNKPLWLPVIGVPLIWYALASLSYPVSTDALYFHLGLPKIYAAAGYMSYIPANLFSASPQTSEMISTAFYSMGLERGAQLFIMLVAAILVLSVWRRAGEFGGSGTIAILILFTIPIFAGLAVGSKNDYLLWGLSFFAIMKFIQFDQTGRESLLLLAGIGAGMGAGTKAIGLALFGPPALVLLYNIGLGKYRLSHLLKFSVCFGAFAAPWYIYSWIMAGNPVFPFFDNIFHSPYSSTLFNDFNKELAIKSVDRSALNLIISPVRMVFQPESYDGRLGYGIVLFPAMLAFTRKVPRGIKVAMAISIIFYLIWFFGFPFARFILPVAPFLAIGGSYYFLRLSEGRKAWRVVATLSLALGVALPIPPLIRDTLPRVRSVIKDTPKYEFLENYRTLDPYQPRSGETIAGLSYIKCWKYINDVTPAEFRIGILTSFWTRADGYYLDRDFIYLNPSEQNVYDFTQLKSDEAIESSLKRLGIGFIVLDSTVLEQYSSVSPWAEIEGFEKFADGVRALRSFCMKNGTVIYADNRYLVYRLPLSDLMYSSR
jgi:hypothetical protein